MQQSVNLHINLVLLSLAKNICFPSKLHVTLRKNCPNSEFFWFVFSCIRTEYRDLFCTSLCSVPIHENADHKTLRIRSLFTQCTLFKMEKTFVRHAFLLKASTSKIYFKFSFRCK